MTIDEQIKYWIEIAENDVPVMDSLFEKSHYVWSLYIGHLIIEKILKAYYVYKNKETPPKTHNLIFLARKSDLSMTEEIEDFLYEVNDFNIEARYPEYKTEFYKKCDKEFAEFNIKKIKESYLWIKSQLI